MPLKPWTVYADDAGRTVVHTAGFSWLAAFTLPLWALLLGLYRTAAAAVVISFGAGWLLALLNIRFPGPFTQTVLPLAWGGLSFLAAGYFASRWHKHLLERNGWVPIASESREEVRG